MKAKKFKVRSFKNSNGTISWRVSGSLNGKQIRKNFKTHAEASAERQSLEIQRLNSENDLRLVASRLTSAELKQAEVAISRLNGTPLSQAVDWYLTTYKEPNTKITIADAMTEFLGFQENRIRALSFRDYLNISKYALTAIRTSRSLQSDDIGNDSFYISESPTT